MYSYSGRTYRQDSRDSRQHYALTIAGEKLYVITATDDVSAIHKNTKSLSFDGFVQNLMATMTAEPATIAKLYHRPSMHEMSPIAQNANPKADHYISQPSPGQKLDTLNYKFLEHMDKELDLGRLPIDAHEPNSSGAHRYSVTLTMVSRRHDQVQH